MWQVKESVIIIQSSWEMVIFRRVKIYSDIEIGRALEIKHLLRRKKKAINNSLPDAIMTLTHIDSVKNLRGNGQSCAAFIVNARLYVRAKVPRALLKGILDRNDVNTVNT